VKTSLSAWSSQRNSSWRNYTYLTEVTLTTGTLVEAEHWLAQSLAAHADLHRITLDTVERLLLACDPPCYSATTIPACCHALWVGRSNA
jgi:hypothetical protein